MQPSIRFHQTRLRTTVAAAVLGLCSACGDVSPTTSTSAAGGDPIIGSALGPDVDGAPVTLGYTIQGAPVVGKTVGVELSVETPLDNRPITLAYRVNEAGSLTFPESQPQEVEIVPVAGAELRPVQVTVIPQRDGRVFLTVTATIETDRGSVKKAMAVPLQVTRGASPEEGEDNA